MAVNNVWRERKWWESQRKWKKNTSLARTQSEVAKKKLQGGCHGSDAMCEKHGREPKEERFERKIRNCVLMEWKTWVQYDLYSKGNVTNVTNDRTS